MLNYSLTFGYSNKSDNTDLVVSTSSGSFNVPFGQYFYKVDRFDTETSVITTLEASAFVFSSAFYDSDLFSYSDCEFTFTFTPSGLVLTDFVPKALNIGFYLRYDDSFVSPSLLSSGGSSSTSPFIVPDLDGNFGAYAKGTIVNVASRSGDFIVEASQFMWAFPSSDFMGSCIVYYLSQNGKNILVPDFLLTLKAAS